MNHATEILTILLSVLGGGGLLALLNYLAKRRADQNVSQQGLMEEWRKEVIQSRQENSALREEVSILTALMNDLKNKLMMLEASHASLPIPQWIKGLDGRMITLNTPYETVFLKPNLLTRKDYINQTDFVAWPHDIAKSYVANDQIVIQTGKKIITTEKVKLGEEISYWNVLKYPIIQNNRVIAVGGIAFKQDLTKPQREDAED